MATRCLNDEDGIGDDSDDDDEDDHDDDDGDDEAMFVLVQKQAVFSTCVPHESGRLGLPSGRQGS